MLKINKMAIECNYMSSLQFNKIVLKCCTVSTASIVSITNARQDILNFNFVELNLQFENDLTE